MDSWTNVESLNFRYEPQNAVSPIVYLQDPLTGKVTKLAIPARNPLNPPLGRLRPRGAEDRAPAIHGETALRASPDGGLRQGRRHADVVTGDGTLSVLRYGGILQARQLVGVRGAGLAFDGLYYVDSTKHQIKPGEYKQSFTLKRNALVSNVPSFPPPHSDAKRMRTAGEPIHRKISRHRGRQPRPGEDRPPAGASLGRLERADLDLGASGRSFAGAQSGFFPSRQMGANVWVEFEQGDSDYPVWSGCFWGSGGEVPPLATASPPGVQTIVLQSVGGNILMISDVPGSSGGILLKSSSGASIAINDTGITITNGQGDHRPRRPKRHHQQRGARRHLGIDGGLSVHHGATVMCVMADKRWPRAESGVTLDGLTRSARAVGSCGLSAGSAGATLRRGAVDHRHDARHFQRPAAGHLNRSGRQPPQRALP